MLQPIKTNIILLKQVNHINTLSEVKEMVKTARQLPLSHISISFAFTHDNPGVFLKNAIVHDIRSIRPVKLAVVLVAPQSRIKTTHQRFVVDLSKRQLVSALAPLFNLSVPFVGYDLKSAYFCWWQLGLPTPETVWDGLVCEQALHLGVYYYKYAPNQRTGIAARISAKTWGKDQLAFQTSLMCACQRHGVPCQLTPQAAFDNHSISFLPSALAAAKLYRHQIAAAKTKGIYDHLVNVEMPFVPTVAHIEWTGVRVSKKRRTQIIEKCDKATAKLQQGLQRHGLTTYRSHDELLQFFNKEGLLHLFRDGSGYSFDRDHLKSAKAHHPAIPVMLALSRLEDIRHSELLAPELVGADGRIHPIYDQLGTATGRLTSHHPSIMSVDGLLRPVVVPEPGRGIGEVDWSQVEVGVAAAMSHDRVLIDMFNTGDVYSAMAQRFYRKSLPKAAKHLPSNQFKQKYPQYRDNMKTCILGLLNGMTPRGLADKLQCSESAASAFHGEFKVLFPRLHQWFAETHAHGRTRGYTSTITNLHRHRGTSGPVAAWEKRWFVNHRIQGSAAAIFKMALNRLVQLYQPHDAHIIVPLHDAVVFEVPLEAFEEVTNLTAKVMCETLEEVFPELKPRVTRNVSKPTCWNRDGKVTGLSRWIRDNVSKLAL